MNKEKVVKAAVTFTLSRSGDKWSIYDALHMEYLVQDYTIGEIAEYLKEQGADDAHIIDTLYKAKDGQTVSIKDPIKPELSDIPTFEDTTSPKAKGKGRQTDVREELLKTSIKPKPKGEEKPAEKKEDNLDKKKYQLSTALEQMFPDMSKKEIKKYMEEIDDKLDWGKDMETIIKDTMKFIGREHAKAASVTMREVFFDTPQDVKDYFDSIGKDPRQQEPVAVPSAVESELASPAVDGAANAMASLNKKGKVEDSFFKHLTKDRDFGGEKDEEGKPKEGKKGKSFWQHLTGGATAGREKAYSEIWNSKSVGERLNDLRLVLSYKGLGREKRYEQARLDWDGLGDVERQEITDLYKNRNREGIATIFTTTRTAGGVTIRETWYEDANDALMVQKPEEAMKAQQRMMAPSAEDKKDDFAEETVTTKKKVPVGVSPEDIEGKTPVEESQSMKKTNPEGGGGVVTEKRMSLIPIDVVPVPGKYATFVTAGKRYRGRVVEADLDADKILIDLIGGGDQIIRMCDIEEVGERRPHNHNCPGCGSVTDCHDSECVEPDNCSCEKCASVKTAADEEADEGSEEKEEGEEKEKLPEKEEDKFASFLKKQAEKKIFEFLDEKFILDGKVSTASAEEIEERLSDMDGRFKESLSKIDVASVDYNADSGVTKDLLGLLKDYGYAGPEKINAEEAHQYATFFSEKAGLWMDNINKKASGVITQEQEEQEEKKQEGEEKKEEQEGGDRIVRPFTPQ